MGVRTLVRRAAVIAAVLSLLAVLSPTGGAGAQPGGQPDASAVAVGYVQGNAAALGLTAADVGEVAVTDEVASRHTGVTHVYVEQRQAGIPVAGGVVNVSVGADGRVLHVGNRFVSDLAAATAGQDASRRPTDAAAAAARHVGLAPTEPLVVVDTEGGATQETTLSDGGVSTQPIPAELAWLPVDGGVRLAWTVEIEPTDGEHWWTVRVDAETGAVLRADDRVVHDDPAAIANAIASPAGAPAAIGPDDTVDDGSSYRVFPIPMESPSDGDRALVENPASALASPFGWHDTDGDLEPDFTRTRGNNVHAYSDRDNDNVPDPGTDPDGGPGLDFDFPLDLGRRPLDSRDAAVTNLFYWNNIIHDVLYEYGFDEASGNFQVNNYGQGGLGADDVRAEAQDGSGRNNANFDTPVDGQRPRMQMFEWRSALPNPIVVAPPSPIAGTYFGPMAGFGESLVTTGPISGEAVYVGRGCDPAYQAGQPLDAYLADAAGRIAMIDRGSCTFAAKVKKAQDLGALMVIVLNNAPGPAIAMGGADPTITIPSVMVTQADGNLFRDNDPFNVTISDGTGGAPDRDSDLDAGVIAHEYGHGLSNRLTGGPGNVDCLDDAEQMGEGWSDFLATTFTANPEDRPTDGRGVGSYVVFQPSDGAGIRPRPYSSDVSVNEFTYASVPGGVASGVLTIPHGIGFVWNTMLWDMYWNLVAKHGFNPNVYDDWTTGGNNLAIQLVVDGMKFQPCEPGFVDGRDAILAADQALTGGANQCAVWRAFAKRGLGFGAAQGSSASVTDGVASFALPANCSPQFGGFRGAVEPPPDINQARGGSTVPVRFRLTENRGLGERGVLAVSQQVDCATLAPVPGAPIEEVSAPVTVDGDSYGVDWKTDRRWAGTCHRLILRIQDVTDPVAVFRFR
jgi:extracellular elastinolytic metalloproteinase